MFNCALNEWIEYIEEEYFNKGNILCKENTIYFKVDTPINEVLKYSNYNSSATLAIIVPYDEDYGDFNQIGAIKIREGKLEVVYQSNEKLPAILIYFNSYGESFKSVNDDKCNEELIKVLLSIDKNIFD